MSGGSRPCKPGCECARHEPVRSDATEHPHGHAWRHAEYRPMGGYTPGWTRLIGGGRKRSISNA